MPGELTEEEQAEQDRLNAEEKVAADAEAEKARLAKEAEDRGDEYIAPDEEKELDSDALAKIAAGEEDPEAKKKAEDAAAEKKKEEDEAAARKAAEGKESKNIDEIDKKIKVPKWRLDEESTKRHELERENALLRSQIEAVGKVQQAAPAKPEEKKKEEIKGFDFDDAEQRYADALVEGDKKKASEIRAEIRTAEETARETKKAEQDKVIETRQALEFEAASIATKMFKEYPFFDSTADKANKKAIAVLIAVRDQAFNSGVPFPQAVQHAFDEVGPMYAHLVEKPTDDKGKKTADELASDKKKKDDEEKARAADTAGKQPPDLKGSANLAGKKINAATLTEAEFDSLPEPEKARLRGDNI